MGDWPTWRRDGKEIFFISTDQKLMAAEVSENAGGLKVREPRALFGITAESSVSRPPSTMYRRMGKRSSSTAFPMWRRLHLHWSPTGPPN